jgi:hypothetical protein
MVIKTEPEQKIGEPDQTEGRHSDSDGEKHATQARSQ